MQLIVEGGCWKAAHLRQGDYCLLGEAVAPGFEFRDFRRGSAEVLSGAFPALFTPRSDLWAYFKPDLRRSFEDYYACQS